MPIEDVPFHIAPNPDTRPIVSQPGTPVPEVDLSSAPDLPDDGPEFPPGTIAEDAQPGEPRAAESPAPSAVPDQAGTVKLPDGREIPIADLVRWADQAVQPAQAPAQEQAPAWAEALARRLDAIEDKATQQAPGQQAPTQAEQDTRFDYLNGVREGRYLNPLSQGQLWMQGHRNQLVRAGYQEPSPEFLQQALHQAQVAFLGQQQEFFDHQIRQQAERAQLSEATSKVKAEVDALTGQFPNLQTKAGLRIRDAFLAQAAATGQKDLKKVFAEANALVYSFVMEAYGTPKQAKLKSVAGAMPRGGGPRAPVKKDFGNDFGAISRLAEARSREG